MPAPAPVCQQKPPCTHLLVRVANELPLEDYIAGVLRAEVDHHVARVELHVDLRVGEVAEGFAHLGQAEEARRLIGPDVWPYGVEANRKILTAFMGYLEEQHFIEKAAPIEDMFAPIVNWSE